MLKRIGKILENWKESGYIPLEVKVSKKCDENIAYINAAFHQAYTDFVYNVRDGETLTNA